MTAWGYLFPGQGAQAVGMGKAFYDQSRAAKDLYQQAHSRVGFDVAALCFEGPQEELTRTERCQVALFVTSLAAYVAFLEATPSARPAAAAGLSLGELTALAAAQVFSFTDGVELVKARGEAMAECAARAGGAMLAVIGLSGDALDGVCRDSGANVANYNTPEQIVLSGPVEAIERAEGLVKAAGAKRAIRLDVAGAFHSSLMAPAAEAFRRALGRVSLRRPAFPVISNVTGQPVQEPDDIRELLVRQLVSPVRWDTSVRTMVQAGVRQFIEWPPAKTLTAMLRRIDASASGIAVNEPQDFSRVTSA